MQSVSANRMSTRVSLSAYTAPRKNKINDTSQIVWVLPIVEIKTKPVRKTPTILPSDHEAESVPYLLPILAKVSAYFFKMRGWIVPIAHAGIKNK